MSATPPLLLTVGKVAKRLGIAPQRVRALVASGAIRSVAVSKAWCYIPAQEVEAFVTRAPPWESPSEQRRQRNTDAHCEAQRTPTGN